MLQVACTEAQQLKKFSICEEEPREGVATNLVACIESAFDLFEAYLTMAENGRILVLHSASCIDSLFELFWVESLRRHVLDQIFELFRVILKSPLIFCTLIRVLHTRAKNELNKPRSIWCLLGAL